MLPIRVTTVSSVVAGGRADFHNQRRRLAGDCLGLLRQGGAVCGAPDWHAEGHDALSLRRWVETHRIQTKHKITQ